MNLDKSGLRQRIRRLRRDLAPAERQAATAAACAAVERLICRMAPAALASYAAIGSELDLVDLHRRWWSAGRPVWLPRVAGQGLTWHAVREADRLHPGFSGIPEPDPRLCPAGELPARVLALVPGLGFTRTGGRLGQGGGFYDRTLPTLSGWAVGVGFPCQLLEDLASEVHDHRLDGLIIAGDLVLDPSVA